MFAIIRNDESVLSHPYGWLSMGVTLATDWRYAVQFETRLGANKSALMHGATVHTVGEYDSPHKGEFDETTRHRKVSGGGVRSRGASVEYRRVAAGTPGSRPDRPVPPGGYGVVGTRRDAGYPVERVAPHAAPDPRRVAARYSPRTPVPEVGARVTWRDLALSGYDEYEKCVP